MRLCNSSWKAHRRFVAIPLQNVYYLLCYAWNRLEARDRVNVSSVPGDRTENLLAKVLAEGTGHLLRSGLDRDYIAEQQDERRVRGKLLISESVKRTLLQRGVAACSVDELSHDIPHNRVLKAALRTLLDIDTVEKNLRQRLRAHLRALHEVSDVALSAEAFRGVRLHRNNARYGLLLQFCELLARCLMPTPGSGIRRFHPFTASDQQMGELFQAFVRNFIAREQSTYSISAPKLGWGEALLDGTPAGWLPEMRTDAVLEASDNVVVAELKYYAQPFSSRYGQSRLHSAHLYQIGTYLDHYAASHANDRRPVTGLLLYAGPPVLPAQTYEIRGRRIHVRSLPLDQPWQSIHDDLLGITAKLRA